MNAENDAETVLKNYLSALAESADIDDYISEDVEYISLNPQNDELKKIMPWTGKHQGLAEFKAMYELMKLACNYVSFDVDLIFGKGESAAAFGNFAYSAKQVGSVVSTPFALLVKVNNGKITYFQFFEDTYITASAYRHSGSWNIENSEGKKAISS
ncbi:nuclear transport factor 2 family protein [Serratia proteamaculans]|uniref:nuclear transport factor 2 family protein n=1 Tax=Serratia proteamaculans TaxID=28151 RepID=UPI003CF206D4